MRCTEEWDSHCRQLIVDNSEWIKRVGGLSCKTPCIFGDLMGCVRKNLFHKDDPFWVKFEKVDEAPLYQTQYCFTHGCQCSLVDKKADLEVAGLPCPDYSVAGKRLQENGPTIGAFLTHAKRHVSLQTRIIVVENVKDQGLIGVVSGLECTSFKTIIYM